MERAGYFYTTGILPFLLSSHYMFYIIGKNETRLIKRHTAEIKKSFYLQLRILSICLDKIKQFL